MIYLIIRRGGFPWKVLLKFWFCTCIQGVEKWAVFIVHLQLDSTYFPLLFSLFSLVYLQRLICIFFHPVRFIWTINACFEQMGERKKKSWKRYTSCAIGRGLKGPKVVGFFYKRATLRGFMSARVAQAQISMCTPSHSSASRPSLGCCFGESCQPA